MHRSAKSAITSLVVAMASPSLVVGQADGGGDGKRVGTPGEGKRWAVVIGVNEYTDPAIPALRYCVEDARLLERTLEEHCGFQDNVLILAGNQPGGPRSRPTAKNIGDRVPKWLAQAKAEDTVILYYSGHGLLDPDGRIYLAPEDCDPADLKRYGVSAAQLREMLSQCAARNKLLMLDCCHAGASDKRGLVVNLEKPKNVTSAAQLAEVFGSAKGFTTIGSCREDEYSYEWGAKQHGLFTYFLVEGLTGKADGDRDGIVDVVELFKYVHKNVSETSLRDLNAKQTPIQHNEGTDVLGLTWLPEGRVPAVRKVQARFAEPSGRVVAKGIRCSGSVSNWDPSLHLWLAVEVGPYLWFKDSEVAVDPKTNAWAKEIDEAGTSPFVSLGLYAADEAAHRDILAWVEKGKKGESFERISFVKGTARVDHVDNLRTVNRIKAQFTEPGPGPVAELIRCSGSVSNWDPSLHLWLAVEEGGRLWFKDSEVAVDPKTNAWAKEIDEAGTSPFVSLGLYAADEAAHRDISAWVERGKSGQSYETLNAVNGTTCLARLENLEHVARSAPPSPR